MCLRHDGSPVLLDSLLRMTITNASKSVPPVVAEQQLTADQQQLVLENAGLAYSLAGQFRSRVHKEDIQQDALLGLCEAARRFKGSRADSQDFCRFAGAWIMGQLLRGNERRESCRRGDRAAFESSLAESVLFASEPWLRRRSESADRARVQFKTIALSVRSRSA